MGGYRLMTMDNLNVSENFLIKEDPMDKFVTCKILEISNHPQANKLKVAKVSDGTTEFTIVCGAKNIRLNMLSVLAKIGATTPSGMLIQESTIRGVNSQGMLCSALELGISQEQGIIDLPPTIPIGANLNTLPTEVLSSTPWWSYKLVERFFIDTKTSTIKIQKDEFEHKLDVKKFKILSETYWFNGKYHYRQFA